jgi:hypothetical protein
MGRNAGGIQNLPEFILYGAALVNNVVSDNMVISRFRSGVTVPVPNHREVRAGTLLSIIRQSELPRGISLSII